MSFYTLFAKLQRLAYITDDDDLLNSVMVDLFDGEEIQEADTAIGAIAAEIQLEYTDDEVDDVIDFLEDRIREIEVARDDAKCLAEIEAVGVFV